LLQTPFNLEPIPQWLNVADTERPKAEKSADARAMAFAGAAGSVVSNKGGGWDAQLGGQVTQCRGGYLARGAGKTSFDLNKFEENCKTEPVVITAIGQYLELCGTQRPVLSLLLVGSVALHENACLCRELA
jgi:hypothetical protein